MRLAKNSRMSETEKIHEKSRFFSNFTNIWNFLYLPKTADFKKSSKFANFQIFQEFKNFGTDAVAVYGFQPKFEVNLRNYHF